MIVSHLFGRQNLKQRTGISLLEVTIVLGLMTLLSASLASAVQLGFGKINKMKCENRLKSLALVINTIKVGRRYPTIGFRNIKSDERKKIQEILPANEKHGLFSWRVGLLEFIEQQALSRELKNSSKRFSLSPFNKQVVITSDDKDEPKRMLATIPVKDFICPSFSPNKKSETSVLSDAEYKKYYDVKEKQGVGIANYVSLSATSIEGIYGKSDKKKQADGEGWDGVIIDGKKGVKSIFDGASKTLMLTESREQRYASWIDATTSWVVAYHPSATEKPFKNDKGMWTGSESALNVGPNKGDKNKEVYFSTKDGWQGKKDWQWGPSSEHAGGVVMHATASGSVMGIIGSGKNSISAELYMRLVTRNGKEVADIPGK